MSSVDVSEVVLNSSKGYAADCVGLQNTSNLRMEVKDSEAQIRRDIAKSECDIKHSFCELTNHIDTRFADIHNNIRDAKEESIKANYENRLISERLAKEQLIETFKSTKAVEDKLTDKFATLTAQLAECCCTMEKNAIDAKLFATTDELTEQRLKSQADGIIAAVLAKITLK